MEGVGGGVGRDTSTVPPVHPKMAWVSSPSTLNRAPGKRGHSAFYQMENSDSGRLRTLPKVILVVVLLSLEPRSPYHATQLSKIAGH